MHSAILNFLTHSAFLMVFIQKLAVTVTSFARILIMIRVIFNPIFKYMYMVLLYGDLNYDLSNYFSSLCIRLIF